MSTLPILNGDPEYAICTTLFRVHKSTISFFWVHHIESDWKQIEMIIALSLLWKITLKSFLRNIFIHIKTYTFISNFENYYRFWYV